MKIALDRLLLAFLERGHRPGPLVDALEAAREKMSPETWGAYRAGVRAGVELAQSYAEVSEHDGWSRTDPRIDWEPVRKALAAYIDVVLPRIKDAIATKEKP